MIRREDAEAVLAEQGRSAAAVMPAPP